MIDRTKFQAYLYARSLLAGGPRLARTVRSWVMDLLSRDVDDGYRQGWSEASEQFLDQLESARQARDDDVKAAYQRGLAKGQGNLERAVSAAYARGEQRGLTKLRAEAQRQYREGYVKGVAVGVDRAEVSQIKAEERFKVILENAVAERETESFEAGKQLGIAIGRKEAERQAEKAFATREEEFSKETERAVASASALEEQHQSELKKVAADRYREGMQKGYDSKGIALRQAGFKEGYAAAVSARATPLGDERSLPPIRSAPLTWSDLPENAKEGMLLIWNEFSTPHSGQIHVALAQVGAPVWRCAAGSGKIMDKQQIECLMALDLLVRVGHRGGSPRLSLSETSIAMLEENT